MSANDRQQLERMRELIEDVRDTLSDATGLTIEQEMVGDVPEPDRNVVFTVEQLYALAEKCRTACFLLHLALGGTFTIAATAEVGDPKSIMPSGLLPEAESILRRAADTENGGGAA